MEVDLTRQAEWLGEKVERQTALKIEIIRMVIHHASLKASEGSHRVVIFDGAQSLTEEAANALLKLLEEPPPFFQIVLIAEDEAALLDTIRSRCMRVLFRRIPTLEIARCLGERFKLPSQKAQSIAERSGGSLGRALWEKEWAGWETPDWEVMDLGAAFGWLEQFDARQGGRTAAQMFVELLIQKECGRMKEGRLDASGRLHSFLTASAALKQNVSPRLALEALYLRLKR